MRTGFISVVLLSLAACGQTTVNTGIESGTRVNIPFTPDVSINEVMVAQLDHAAHFIWDAADPDRALADVEWQEAEHHAIQIISSRSALSMGGTGVNDAMWIVQQSWRNYVNQMNVAGMLALSSARARDRDGLAQAADLLVESCEGCHQQFKPTIPTEGFSHPH